MSENRLPVVVRFLISLVILVLAVYVFATMLIIPAIKKKAASYATQKAVEVIAEQSGGTAQQEQIKQFYETLPQEDKQKVETIIEDHINAETAAEITTYIQNGDKDGLLQYAQESLTEEELNDLRGLYEKYQTEWEQINGTD